MRELVQQPVVQLGVLDLIEIVDLHEAGVVNDGKLVLACRTSDMPSIRSGIASIGPKLVENKSYILVKIKQFSIVDFR